jgi:hypothetical protein
MLKSSTQMRDTSGSVSSATMMGFSNSPVSPERAGDDHHDTSHPSMGLFTRRAEMRRKIKMKRMEQGLKNQEVKKEQTLNDHPSGGAATHIEALLAPTDKENCSKLNLQPSVATGRSIKGKRLEQVEKDQKVETVHMRKEGPSVAKDRSKLEQPFEALVGQDRPTSCRASSGFSSAVRVRIEKRSGDAPRCDEHFSPPSPAWAEESPLSPFVHPPRTVKAARADRGQVPVGELSVHSARSSPGLPQVTATGTRLPSFVVSRQPSESMSSSNLRQEISEVSSSEESLKDIPLGETNMASFFGSFWEPEAQFRISEPSKVQEHHGHDLAQHAAASIRVSPVWEPKAFSPLPSKPMPIHMREAQTRMEVISRSHPTDDTLDASTPGPNANVNAASWWGSFWDHETADHQLPSVSSDVQSQRVKREDSTHAKPQVSPLPPNMSSFWELAGQLMPSTNMPESLVNGHVPTPHATSRVPSMKVASFREHETADTLPSLDELENMPLFEAANIIEANLEKQEIALKGRDREEHSRLQKTVRNTPNRSLVGTWSDEFDKVRHDVAMALDWSDGVVNVDHQEMALKKRREGEEQSRLPKKLRNVPNGSIPYAWANLDKDVASVLDCSILGDVVINQRQESFSKRREHKKEAILQKNLLDDTNRNLLEQWTNEVGKVREVVATVLDSSVLDVIVEEDHQEAELKERERNEQNCGLLGIWTNEIDEVRQDVAMAFNCSNLYDVVKEEGCVSLFSGWM